MRRVAIVGAGLSGLTAAWQLTRSGAKVTVFEAAPRVGGIIQTVRQDGFVIELGPDSWVTEKPAARELIADLGLGHELIASNDSTRKTHLLLDGRLEAMPDGLRMMVPTSRAALAGIEASPLFSPAARQAFRDELSRAAELQRAAPTDDESIASFTERHFGREVLDRLAAPLLSGVFGGDVGTLSVRAVMAPFVAMERERGSLIAALEERETERITAGRPAQPIFTTLRSGLGTLTDTLAAALPGETLSLNTRVVSIHRADPRTHTGWLVHCDRRGGSGLERGSREPASDRFDNLILATPGHVTAEFLHPIDPAAAALLPTAASSAILVALAWQHTSLALPEGFGFLVPPPSSGHPTTSPLLAATFVDQKFSDRVPPGGRLLRAFFGGASARTLLANNTSDTALANLAHHALAEILGPLSPPAFAHVSRWPLCLPQYAVGHLERLASLDRHIAAIPGLHLLGNSLRGVGLPDLIRQARTLSREILEA